MVINKIIIVTTISFFSVVLSCGLSQPAFAGTFPGSNGKIAFTNGDIYLMNPDGTGITKLDNDYFDPNNCKFDTSSSWLANGTKIAIAYSEGCANGSIISFRNADGTGVTGLVGIGGGEPSWSPDGTKIATVSVDNMIYISNVDGTGTPTLLTAGENPSWSPDGKKIAFTCYGSGLEQYEYDICTINPDGTGLAKLTDNSIFCTNPNTYCYFYSAYPSWSPDGTKIVFASNADLGGSSFSNIYTMNADGSEVARLTTDYPSQEMYPSWSPDGTKIVFTSNPNIGSFNIVTINVNGTGTPSILTNVAYYGNIPNASWQPIPRTSAPLTTTLTLNSISSVPWGNKITVSGQLVDQLGHNVSGATISFNGTGGGSIANATTDVNGLFTTTGTAPNSVRTGWTVQAHFAGDTLYLSSNSLIQNYNTVKHTVSLALTKPANVPWSRPTALTGSLTDTIAGGAISAKTISFTGTGVIGVASVNTNATGVAVGHGTSPSTVSAGLTVQAHFAGDALYNAADSTVQTFNTLRHNVSLGLSPPANVPWSRPTSFVMVLTDTTSGNTVISGAPISFIGTGVIGVASVNTNATGVAVGHGTSPSTVSAGWTAQAHFAGNGHYNAADSLVKTYNILAHSTSLALSLSPSTVLHGTLYNVTGTLMDVTANVPLGSQTVTFTATAPITIPSQVTSTTGTYSAMGRIAPSTSGSYGITSHFAATSLYAASNSPTRTLIVT